MRKDTDTRENGGNELIKRPSEGSPSEGNPSAAL